MAQFTVKFAIYGALPNGQSTNGEAFDVTNQLGQLLSQGTGVVSCDNNSFGDPAQGSTKHFGAVVNRDGTDFFFACQEGQTIDFNQAGGMSAAPSRFMVLTAIYGALPKADRSMAEAADVTKILQDRLNQNSIVACNNGTFGDPAPNYAKHFAAVVMRDNTQLTFACAEGQSIDFSQGGGTT